MNTNVTTEAKGNKFRENTPKNRTYILLGKTLGNPRIGKNTKILTNYLCCINEQSKQTYNKFTQYELEDGKSFRIYTIDKK